MATLTDCETKKTKRQVVSPLGLACCLFWTGLLTSLALLHVYIQFSISDQKIAARQIQSARVTSENRARELRVEFERLRGADHIQLLAAQWDMNFDAARRVERIVIPRELATKYEARDWRRSGVGPAQESMTGFERVVAGVAGIVGQGSAYADPDQ